MEIRYEVKKLNVKGDKFTVIASKRVTDILASKEEAIAIINELKKEKKWISTKNLKCVL